MKIKFTQIGLGVMVATSENEETIYLVVGPGLGFANINSFLNQKQMDFIQTNIHKLNNSMYIPDSVLVEYN